MNELMEMAWVIIANANGGHWEKATPEWKAAAEKWRDEYLKPTKRFKGIVQGLIEEHEEKVRREEVRKLIELESPVQNTYDTTHLGDGVYATLDRNKMVTLKTGSLDPTHEQKIIYLEAEVMDRLYKWYEDHA